MGEFMQEINWSPLWISLKTGAVATTITFFLGIWCARKIMKMKPVSRAVLDGILTMPLVLPPTVAGFFLLIIFSLRRPFGKFLLENFDFKIVQTWKGCHQEYRDRLQDAPLPLHKDDRHQQGTTTRRRHHSHHNVDKKPRRDPHGHREDDGRRAAPDTRIEQSRQGGT